MGGKLLLLISNEYQHHSLQYIFQKQGMAQRSCAPMPLAFGFGVICFKEIIHDPSHAELYASYNI